MKVGILTFINANNYGAVLQGYALHRYVESMAEEVELLNYYPSTRGKKHSIQPHSNRHLFRKINAFVHPIQTINRKKKVHGFQKFRNNYIKIGDQRYDGEIETLEKQYDIVIAGSDQIWNTDLNGESKSFYLEFDTSAKKVAYAASVGRIPFTDKDKDMIHKYIKGFNKISVRENSLYEYLLEYENIESKVVVDPVFLLQKEEWQIISIRPKVKEKYIFVYAMEYTKSLERTVLYYQKHMGLNVYCLWGGGDSVPSNMPGKKIFGVGPREFLGWIENASLVLTNSFHGAAFSIIFGKELCVVEHSTRNERLVQLLESCNFLNQMIRVGSLPNNEQDVISGNVAYKNMNMFICESKAYIQNLCRGKLNE